MPRPNAPEPHIGGTIKILRLARDWKQERIAIDLGCTAANVTQIEARGCLNLKTLTRIAAVFEIQPSELLRIHEKRMAQIARCESKE